MKSRQVIGLIVSLHLAVLAGLVFWGCGGSPGARPAGNRVVLLRQAPPDGALLRYRENLSWTFSDAMTLQPGNPAAAGTLTIEPPVPGIAEWTHPNVLTFVPYEPWPQGREIRATLALPPSLVGRKFKPETFRYFGCPPLVGQVLREGDDTVGRTLSLRVQLTRPMDEAAFRKAFSLAVPGGDVSYAIAENEGKVNYLIRTGRIQEAEVAARFDVSPGAGAPRLRLWEGVIPVIEPMEVVSTEILEEHDEFSVKVIFSQPPAAGWEKFLTSNPSTNLTVEASTSATVRVLGLQPAGLYALNFLAGLPGRNGSVITQDLQVVLSIPELRTRMTFRDRGHYLSSAGSRKVVLETVNVQAVKLAVWNVYPNNLVDLARSGTLYQDNQNPWWNVAEDRGDLVTNRLVKIEPGKNVVRKTVVDLSALTGGKDEGVFCLVAEDESTMGRTVNKIVVLTDLGLSVIRHDNEVLVWALSIRDGTPVAGVEVCVFSTKNQLVGKAVTDASGLARVVAAKMPALSVVTGVKESRLAMVKLDESLVQGPVDESDRLFLGSGYEAFLYADRGIYRPGETAHVKAVVRGPQLACPAPFPVQMKVLRPDSAVFARLTAVLTEAGTAEFELPFLPESLTGPYTLDLEAGGKDRVIGSLSLQVEDFVPPTLAVTVQAPTNRETVGRPISVGVEARHLFGSPAANSRVSLRARLGSAPFRTSRYPDYSFGDSRRTEVWRTLEIGEKRLDASGKAHFEVTLPADVNPAAALSCTLAATVFEDSGRACPAVATFPVDPQAFYIGLKAGQADWKAGETVRLQAVAVRPDGTPAQAGELKARVSRITWNWREELDWDGRSQFRYDRHAEPVMEGALTPTNGPAEVVWKKAQEGDYELVVTDASGAIAASLSFYVADGTGWSGSGFRQPDRVSVKFDRETYKPGEEAVVTVQAPFPGQLLMTLENDRIRLSQVLTMTGNSLEVRIPVQAGYWPNLFVRAVVVRPQAGAASVAGRIVVRAVGMASVAVSRPEAGYRVSVTAPERLHPLHPLEAVVEVKDGAGKPVACEVTVAAVDEGILRLTGYKTPEPIRYFGESRNLEAWLHDVYSLILPDPDAGSLVRRLHAGGDAMGDEMAGRLNPIRSRRFIPVALWSGTLRTDANGRAQVSLPVPEFSGQLRITAVAVGAQGFGSADKAVQVRRDWVVQSTLPRAAAPGDRFSLGCSLFNESGSSGVVTVVVTARGALDTESKQPESRTIALPASGSSRVQVPLVASGGGVGEVSLDIQAGGERWADRIEMPVRPPWPRVILSGAGAVNPGKSARIDMALPWFPNTGNGRLICSGQPGLEGLGALDFLNDYPYGCLEQTVSRAYPYLVAEDLIAAAGRGYLDRRTIGERVGAGIRSVLALQTAGGGFSLWPRQMDTYDWGSAYAVLFLAEARAAGYGVPQEALDRGCTYLLQKMSGWLKEEYLPDRAPCAVLALQALAVAGKPDQASLSRLIQADWEWDFDSRARLVMALLAAGRRPEAAVMLNELSEEGPSEFYRESGSALRSSVRHAALMLDSWLQVDPASPAIPPLVKALLESRRDGHWETTQENAAVLLALGRYAKQHKPGSESCQGVLIPATGETRMVKDGGTFAYDDPRLLNKLVVSNTGNTVLYYAWTASGVPAGTAVPQEDKGIRIRRTVSQVNSQPGTAGLFKQGDLAVVKLTLDGLEEPIDNLVIEELLPGGLEIENPSLNGGYAGLIPEEELRIPVVYKTLRDDRLIAFTGVAGNSNSLFYLVRAVTPGVYVWPPATVACMYDPAIRSLNGGGKVQIDP